MTKADLLAHITAERVALEQTVAGLNEGQLTALGPEGWSIKDHLAHLVAWEEVLVIAHVQGRSFAEAARMDDHTAAATNHMTAETGLNDYFYRRDKERSLAETLADLHRSYRRVLSVLDTLPEERLLTTDQDGHPLLEVIAGNTYRHYREHARIIRTLLAPA
jgi:hypothetical protein